jgi:hypothetical protein
MIPERKQNMITDPIKGLLYSRKFLLAVLGFVQTVAAHYLEIPTEIWAAVDLLLVTVLDGIAYEDGAVKGNAGSQTSVMTTAPASVTVTQPAAADGEQGAVKVDETAGDGVGSAATGILPKVWEG